MFDLEIFGASLSVLGRGKLTCKLCKDLVNRIKAPEYMFDSMFDYFVQPLSL